MSKKLFCANCGSALLTIGGHDKNQCPWCKSRLPLITLAHFHASNLVEHVEKGYVGWTDGVTTIKKFLERKTDTTGVRVRLPGGGMWCASPGNLKPISVDIFITKAAPQLQQGIEARHKARLQEKGVAYGGVRKRQGSPRSTHCYACKSPLTSLSDLECVSCGWILCECGACGCDFTPGL